MVLVRFVVVDGRAGVVVDGQVFDVEQASGGRVSSDPMVVLSEHWGAVTTLADEGTTSGGKPPAEVRLEAPVPRPPLVLTVIASYPPTERLTSRWSLGRHPRA
jgi:hypothetical protein